MKPRRQKRRPERKNSRRLLRTRRPKERERSKKSLIRLREKLKKRERLRKRRKSSRLKRLRLINRINRLSPLQFLKLINPCIGKRKKIQRRPLTKVPMLRKSRNQSIRKKRESHLRLWLHLNTGLKQRHQVNSQLRQNIKK